MKTRRRLIESLIPALMVFIGVSIFLYPQAAQWLEQKAQADALRGLSSTTDQVGPDTLQALLAEANAYNEALTTGVGFAEFDYERQLSVDGSPIMARLKIPSIDLDQPIRHGMSEEALLTGLGHLEGSSLPVGGGSTHSVIGGHRGLATAVGFTHLDKVKIGDEITVEVAGQALVYRAATDNVLDPGTAELQPIEANKDLLTLITCTPLGMNTHRIVIQAERVLPTPIAAQEAVGAPSQHPHFPWWLVIWIGTAVLCGGYVRWKTRQQGDSQETSVDSGAGIKKTRRSESLHAVPCEATQDL